METRKISDNEEERLPFSFKETEITAEKIKEHWQKIADKIAVKRNSSTQEVKGTENEPDGLANS